MTKPRIRKAVEADVCNLLPLMRELAEFEKYANDFAVTEEVLREQGFRRSPPDFYCLIAESGGELVGPSFIILCPSLIEQSRIC